MVKPYALRNLLFAVSLGVFSASASACLNAYTFTASPLPVNGTYACGQTVTFCFTVTSWTQQNSNWFHGVSVALGPGWDASTLTPGTPPPACSPPGTWDWYNSVTGTAGTNIGPQGPGFFFNTGPPGVPGNNYGDNCSGSNLNWQFCWTVTAGCNGGADLSVTVDTFGDSETGGWSSQGCHNDPIPVSAPAVVENCPVAGIGNSIDLCSSQAPVNLLTQLLGNPSPGGVWTGPGGTVVSAALDPATAIGGNYTYTVTSIQPPCSDAATLNVTINQQPVAGVDSSITVCSNGAPFLLVNALGGNPGPGGTWTTSGGVSVPATFNPATGSSGTYGYHLTAPAPCAWVNAFTTITVNPAPSAGNNGVINVCATGSAVPLFSGLGGSATGGGSWTDADGNPVGAAFNPSGQPLGAQVFTYTVIGLPPCGTVSSTVTVNVINQPNAGTGATITLCSTDAAVDLFPLLGTSAQPGGIWTAPGGGSATNIFTPGTSAPGNYAYTVAGTAPCISSVVLVHVTVNTAPNAGTNAVLNYCASSTTPVALFTLLSGANAGGTWTAPNNTSSNGTFNPLLSETGVFTYTVPGTAPCASASATVTVNAVPQPSAGTNASLQVCNSSASVNLFSSLGSSAQSGGTWTGPGGVASNGVYTPGISPVGNYTYSISATAPCLAATAVITVSAFIPPDAGTDGSLLLCSSDATTNLYPALVGSSAGGTWTTPGGGSSNGSINPASAASGSYSYTLPANGPCPADVAQVQVAITPAPHAGTNATHSLCSSNNASYSLFTALGGSPDAGGSWTTGGIAHGPNYIPGTDVPGVFTYTVQGGAPCGTATATVTMSVVQAADAGTGGTAQICAGSSAFNPGTWLTGNPQPGGVWTGPAGNTLTTVYPATALSGSYTYTVQGTAPCPADQAVMLVTVNQLPNAGNDASVSLCMDANMLQMLGALGGTPNLNGTWNGPSTLVGGMFMPGTDTPGVYTYTVPGSGACAGIESVASVTVAVDPIPVPLVSFGPVHGCVPFSLQGHVVSPVGLVAASWNFGDGYTGNGYPNASHVYTAGGTYSVHGTVTDAAGCVGTFSFPGLVFTSQGPVADFQLSAPSVGVEQPEVQVFHLEDPDVQYSWSLDGHTLTGSGNFTLTVDPAVIGYHLVCLTATDSLDCPSELCRNLLVDDNLGVYVPNAFSPDGDGNNEVFLPVIIGYAPETYELDIFDRWGTTVFSSKDGHEAWNGAKNNNGAVLPQAVYVWRVTARDQFTTEQREWFGTVTLVK
ncbi:MAG: gliding motility-associated C-terminal domain-containing protein [Flavobacteriales bacterium]|nr:gliding motility-associated C-terminal domain-containing protein [Flavobacteriales bacterium]